MKYFKLSEFDSPDLKGSGENMQASTLEMLDKAREMAGVPFKINSGYRTPKHNKAIGGAKNSAHIRGYAADIAVTDVTRETILKSLYMAGFRRLGIANGFIHADNDPTLPQSIWGYPCKKRKCAPIKYNSFTKIAKL